MHTLINLPFYCTVHVYVHNVINFCDLFEWKRIYAGFFIVCFYMYCWRDPVIKRNQEGRVRIPLTCLTPPHVCACPKSEPGFTSSYVVIFSCLVRKGERWLFVLLILKELLTITVYKLSFHNTCIYN